MSKSYWMKKQEGNFSKKGEDTFDPDKRYVGIRLQQGVPLLDRDWNEFEDIRRYEELMLRKWYVGNGSPDNGFEISAVEPPANDFKIAAGRCIVDGFDVVNEPEEYLFSIDVGFKEDLNKEGIISEKLKDEFKTKKDITLSDNAYVRKRKENKWVIADTEKFIVKKEEEEELKVYEVAKSILYSQQDDVADLTVPTDEDTDDSGCREDTVYLDVWIEERKSGKGEYDAPDNSEDVNVPTCVRHRLEWRVRVDEGNKRTEEDKVEYHHYYDLAKIIWKDGKIKELKEDLRTIKLKLTSVKDELEDVRSTSASKDELEKVKRTSASKTELEYVRQATVNRWINGGEIEYKRYRGVTYVAIDEILCIIGGQEIEFGGVKEKINIEDENLVVLARTNDIFTVRKIEFIVTRKNLLEWLNSWTFEMRGRDDYFDKPVLKSTFSLPLYFFEPVGDYEFKKTDLRHHGVLDIWLTGLAGRLDAPERRMCRVPLLQQTIFGRAVPVATAPVGNSPRGVAFDGTHIWVANSGSNNVSKIDIITNEIETVSLFKGSAPRGVAFDGTYIWVVNYGSNNVSKIDIITNRDMIKPVSVGRNPVGVAFDGTHIWVANSGSNNVSKIDIITNEIETVSVGSNPRGVAFDGTHIWVANHGSNNVSKIDIITNEIETVSVESHPVDVAFDGTYIWVANSGSNNVSKIDTITNRNMIKPVSVGSHPVGVAFDGTHIWVVNYGSNNVSKIDIITNRNMIKPVSVGSYPVGIAFDGTHIWVTNFLDSSVSKILRGDLR